MIELKIAADSAAEALNDLAELAKIVGLIEGVAEERNKTATQTEKAQSPSPVSYTHLTLPTSDLV